MVLEHPLLFDVRLQAMPVSNPHETSQPVHSKLRARHDKSRCTCNPKLALWLETSFENDVHCCKPRCTVWVVVTAYFPTIQEYLVCHSLFDVWMVETVPRDYIQFVCITQAIPHHLHNSENLRMIDESFA